MPPESYTLTVDGRGAPGFAKGTGHVQLIDQGDDATLMKYEGDMQVGGKLAGVGQRMLGTVSKRMTRQGLETLNKALQARKQGEVEGQEVEFTPPSETEFAAAVAKDMAREMLPPAQSVGIIIAVVAAVLIVVLLLGRRRSEG